MGPAPLIVVDSSAILAILFQEEEAAPFAGLIGAADGPLVSAISILEVVIVLRSRMRDLDPDTEMDGFARDAGLFIESVTLRQLDHAREAHRRFGRGTGHPARLNFGDCFAYALARERGLPLLFKGEDFVHTDLRSALSYS